LPADALPAFLHLPSLGAAGAAVPLGPDDLHYVRRVCRGRDGDLATATDGAGKVAEVRLEDLRGAGRAVVLRVEERPLRRAATVLCGAPEGERADWLVEKLAELGIAVFQPVDCARGGWGRAAGRLERWQRLTVAALRQSRQAHRMEVRAPLPLAAAVAALDPATARWLAEPTGAPPAAAGQDAPLEVVAIGPAGGFNAAERDLMTAAGFTLISLSDNRLRTETAALAWAAGWAARGLARAPGVSRS
jgi:16S rRNA (uracil1498-N3)-methyltransferase